MRLSAALEGDLGGHLRDDRRAGARAVSAAIRETGRGLTLDLRAMVRAAGLSRRLSNTIRDRAYPSRPSLAARAYVYNRAPHILEPLAQGATIRAKRGRYLAIPTAINRGRSRRAQVRMTPQQMAAQRGMTFVLPTSDGVGLLWCLRVVRGTRLTRARGRAAAYAGGELLVGARSAQTTQDILDQGFVPMFVLLPQVTLSRRLRVAPAIRRRGDEIPGRILRLWAREARR